MRISIEPMRFCIRLGRITLALLLMNGLGILTSQLHLTDLAGSGILRDILLYLIKLFDLNTERNIPTFFNSLLLLLSSVLLYLLGSYHSQGQEQGGKRWKFLAVIFLFLSLDEIAVLHERLIEPVRTLFNVSGILYFAWVIPYSIGLMLLFFLYFRFLKNLPRKTFNLFLLSGIIYVSGAVGMELFQGLEVESFGYDTLLLQLMYTLEETMEMTGLIVFIYALLSYRDFSIELAAPGAS